MKLFFYALLVSITFSVYAVPVDREDEIRNEMWVTSDKSFRILDIPGKWSDKSAVIIAQLNRYEYRKPVMRNLLRYNDYSHYRIKLIDKNAVAEYSEISFLSSRTDNSEGESIKVYVGFKVVKPGGKEIIIDPANAVKMEREYRGETRSYSKLAIPNLEPGDILDYYICEETTRANANLIHFFDPVIYTLPREYPVMSHKLQFRVERKCYINLRSLNGAPELKLVIDEANDEKFYSLDGVDMEGVDNMRWVFPYRELPTIKFRAAYASGKAMRAFDVLLGEPGEVKSSVTTQEVQDMVISMLSTNYDVGDFTKYAKKKLKGVKDPFELATKIYYYYRNTRFNNREAEAVEGNSPWNSERQINFVDIFSTVLKAKKIPHDIVLGIPRNISALNDLLIENEISWLVRVKKGDQYLYFSPFDLNTTPGSFDESLEGTAAYALDGLLYTKKGSMKTITMPASTSKDNETFTNIKIDLADFGKAKLSLKRTITGYNKSPDQYYFMDPFDMRPEESQQFEMTESSDVYIGKKKYQAMKEAYLAKRISTKEETLKSSLEKEFDLKVPEVSNFKIEQTGRYATAPAFIYSCDFVTDNLVNKAGPNYVIDAGKLIEQQTQIKTEEVDRKNNIYYEYPHTYKFLIEIDIPKGYQAQGLEKFNQKVENKNGGFTSTAKEANGKVVIETIKHYDVNYAPAGDWKSIVAFLNAAASFNEQKILLKKK
jgi:hypothetical protein